MKPFTPELTVASPGRINLIGEHTDYNLGFVLPTAIDKKITFQFRRNGTDHDCKVRSLTYDTSFQIDLKLIEPSENEWENYILGVLYEISKRTNKVRGFDCEISSTLPVGSGVSSSAALECGMAFGLNELFDLGLSSMDIITLSRDAEHLYVGTQCGIMDQFASVMSKADHVILLDCKSLKHTYIPAVLSPYKLVLLNSNVTHNLASSEYNTRRKECEEGVAILQKKEPSVNSLRDANSELLQACKGEMSDTVYRRCKFIIEENQRVLGAADALKNNEPELLGTLLYQGHHGLSKLYEIGCEETDYLVDFAKDYDGVLGARQMGGGFGGCTINLVREDVADAYVESISEAYFKQFGIRLSSFDGILADGTSAV
ncbi:galactokinase [Poritiphilus flavus]|uniref:Galactokinase n=1 Tax=Poritiphilus flavus TaxID=2697053 RepID=A0A6L9E7B5_9FLAO|nr:galactokinase [Poritiphilus flavus]NAS10580.1 galactokinase [Poritiphilus flavus]